MRKVHGQDFRLVWFFNSQETLPGVSTALQLNVEPSYVPCRQD